MIRTNRWLLTVLTLSAAVPVLIGAGCPPSPPATSSPPVASSSSPPAALSPSGPAGSGGGCTLRLAKRADRDHYLPGQRVTFTVTVADTSGDCSDATVTDDLRGALDDAGYDGDASATAGSLGYVAPLLTWHGSLHQGDTASFRYTMTPARDDRGDLRMVDFVSAPGSNCGTGSEPGCRVELGTPRWVVTKREDVDDIVPGERIRYTITAHNTGTVDFTGARRAVIEDDMSQMPKDTVYDADASATSGAVSFSRPFVQWRGDLPAGASVQIHLSITGQALPRNVSVLENLVRARYPHHGGTDLSHPLGATASAWRDELPPAGLPPEQVLPHPRLVDACAVNPVTDMCDVTADEPKLTVLKTADVRNAVPGQVVSYRVSFANIGDDVFPAGELPVVTDDLSGVLRGATLLAGSLRTGGGRVSFDAAARQLRWQGQLRSGAHGFFSYQVRILPSGRHPGTLRNVVVAPDSVECPPGSRDARCSVTVRVLHALAGAGVGVGLGLAMTGGDPLDVLLIGGGLVALGGGFVLVQTVRARRSRRG